MIILINLIILLNLKIFSLPKYEKQQILIIEKLELVKCLAIQCVTNSCSTMVSVCYYSTNYRKEYGVWMSGKRTSEKGCQQQDSIRPRNKIQTNRMKESQETNNRPVHSGLQCEQECHPDNWGSYIWTASPCEEKVVTKIPITHLLKSNLLCSPNMRSFKSSPGRACNGLAQLRLKT